MLSRLSCASPAAQKVRVHAHRRAEGDAVTIVGQAEYEVLLGEHANAAAVRDFTHVVLTRYAAAEVLQVIEGHVHIDGGDAGQERRNAFRGHGSGHCPVRAF